MTSLNSDDIKSISNTTDSDIQARRQKVRNFIYPVMPNRKPQLYDKYDKIIKISTNLYELQFQDNFHNLTLFKIEVEPPLIEESNYFLKRQIYNYIETNFPAYFKKNFFGGNTLFSFIYCGDENNKNSYEKIQFKEKIKEKEYEITLTKIKEVKFDNVNDFSGHNQKIKLYIETLIRNIVMKNPNVIYFKDRTLFEINLKNIVKINSNSNENIFRGYMTSAHITENGLYALINNINKVISGKTVLQKIKEIEKEYENLNRKEIIEKIKEYFQNHKTVITTYGVPKAFRIKDIDFDINPKNYNIMIKDDQITGEKGRTVTLFNYYKTQYNIELSDDSQPLIEVEHKNKKKNSETKNNNNNNEDQEYRIYLIPELVYITGREDRDINIKRRDRNLRDKTKMNPDKKMELINGFLNLYNSSNRKEIKKGNQSISLKSPQDLAKEWGIKLGNNLTFEGRIISPPKLHFNNKQDSLIKNGLFRPFSPIKPFDIKIENLFYIYDINDKNDKINHIELIRNICDKFAKKGFKNFYGNKENIQGFGLKNTWNWDSIEHELRNINFDRKKFSFGFIFCGKKLEKNYEKLKEYFLKKCNIPTQHLLLENLYSKRNEYNSILFNIVDQVNVKAGGMNYYIDFKEQKVIGQNDKILVIGLDTKINKDQITYSMTSSKHPKLNLFTTQEKTVNKKIKEQKSKALQSMFKNAILEIKKMNISPDYIIIYRQGGNEYYNKCLAIDELELFKEVLKNLREENKENKECNYQNTKLYYICCNLKPDLKFFEESGNNVPKYNNPLSGLVVDSHATQKNKFEFYLQPQYVNQGAATPSHYQVMYYDQENNTLDMENLQKLTYYLTYYYWTWHGAIRIPAILKFSTTALDFYSKCLNPNKETEEFKFEKPYYI